MNTTTAAFHAQHRRRSEQRVAQEMEQCIRKIESFLLNARDIENVRELKNDIDDLLNTALSRVGALEEEHDIGDVTDEQTALAASRGMRAW